MTNDLDAAIARAKLGGFTARRGSFGSWAVYSPEGYRFRGAGDERKAWERAFAEAQAAAK